jgi:hypothetical protein
MFLRSEVDALLPPSRGSNRLTVAEAREWLARRGGKGIPHEEAMRRLGLKCDSNIRTRMAATVAVPR